MVNPVDNGLKAIEWRLARDEWCRQHQGHTSVVGDRVLIKLPKAWKFYEAGGIGGSLFMDIVYLVYVYGSSSWTSAVDRETMVTSLCGGSIQFRQLRYDQRVVRHRCLKFAASHDAPLAYS